MNKLLQKLVDIASSQVGVLEEGGNNRGSKVVIYQGATWLKPDAWPWCSAFMCWCLKEWFKIPEVRAHFNLKMVESWRCRDASAFGWISWAKQQGLYVTDEHEPAKEGDIVVFDFSHIGIVTADQLPGKDYIETIEGNTNGKGERDSVTGDGVFRKIRKTNLVRAYIRIIK